MSAFLGPIHHWLYNKVKIQHNIVEDIIAFSESKNLNIDLKNRLNKKFGNSEIKELEEVIDVSNIHGWLQQKVALEEYRLAYSVTEILNVNPDIMDELKKLFYEIGKKEASFNEHNSLSEIYKGLNDTLLDGMPCDRANILVSEEDDTIVWERNVCVHKEYWNEVNGDINNYYILRDEFIAGFLENANVSYEKLNETTSRISRR